MKKPVLTQEQMIMTSEWNGEHPFAGQNTQQVINKIANISQTLINKPVLQLSWGLGVG